MTPKLALKDHFPKIEVSCLQNALASVFGAGKNGCWIWNRARSGRLESINFLDHFCIRVANTFYVFIYLLLYSSFIFWDIIKDALISFSFIIHKVCAWYFETNNKGLLEMQFPSCWNWTCWLWNPMPSSFLTFIFIFILEDYYTSAHSAVRFVSKECECIKPSTEQE